VNVRVTLDVATLKREFLYRNQEENGLSAKSEGYFAYNNQTLNKWEVNGKYYECRVAIQNIGRMLKKSVGVCRSKKFT